MKKDQLISIVICTFNRAKELEKYALSSIQKLNYKNFELIIVDDNSKDNTKEVADIHKNKIKNFKYIKNKRNKGLCYVRNLGIKHSKGKIVAFTDDDCYVDKNWLREIMDAYKKDKNIVCVGGKSYIRNSKKLFNKNKEIFGCNMSFRKNIFDTFLFDTNIYFNKSSYYDEIDLINRLHDNKLKIKYADKAIVNHFIKPTHYRKNMQIGSQLNLIYIYTKKISLKYYYKIIKLYADSFLFKKKNKSNWDELYDKLIKLDIPYETTYEIVTGLIQVKKSYLENKQKTYANLIRLPWIIYVILLKIPLISRKKY